MVTVVEGNQKAPFSIATTPRCRGGRYSFPWIAPLYPWYAPYNAVCQARRYQVPSKSLTRPGITSTSPGPLVNTLPTRPISRLLIQNWIVGSRTDYLQKMDMALNNLQRLICHKTQPTMTTINNNRWRR